MTDVGSRESLCAKVPRNQCEKLLGIVNKMGTNDPKLRIQNAGSLICVPLVRRPTKEEEALLKAQIPDLTLDVYIFPMKIPRSKTPTEVLENQLPPSLVAKLPRALDIVGDIAIIEIPPELKQQETLVGKAILESHPKVKTVYAKAGAVTGTYRLRELTLIAGEQKTRTLHKEFGCAYRVDVVKAYFSPRLSQEHKRIALLTRKGETIIDLFAGVGPFSVLISKINPEVKVYAVDVNPEAIKLLETNVRLNRVENRVFPILGDAGEHAKGRLAGIADRVIMNLPESAIEFVEAACKATKSKGGIIHFYSFVRRPETVEDLKKSFCEKVEKADRKVDTFLSVKTIRETAPYEQQVVLDARIF